MVLLLVDTLIERTITCLLASALSLIAICWGALIVRAIRSHFKTPVITTKASERHRIESQGKASCGQESNRMLPLVSVIVPARNEQEHIGRCLESILSQS